MFESAISILWGIGCGCLCLLPGWGVGMSAIVSTIIPDSGLYAIASGLILNSVLEARSSTASGNIYTAVYDYILITDTKLLCKALIKWKTIVWVVGILIGLVIPPIVGAGGLFLTYVIALVIIGRNLGKESWWLAIVWISSVSVLVAICTMIGVTNPIAIIGAVLFIIPSLQNLDISKSQCEYKIIDSLTISSFNPNWLILLSSSLCAILSPGISPQSITTTFEDNRAGGLSSYINTAVVEVFIEALAVGQLVVGGGFGKALVNSYAIVPNFWVAVVSCGVVCISGVIATRISSRIELSSSLSSCSVERRLRFIAVAVSTFSVLVMSGLWAVVLVPLGFVINYYLGSKLPPQIKGLTFISLLV